MVLISEITGVINLILGIRRQRQVSNDAYEILRTALEVNLDILQRMDEVFGNEAPTAQARTKLHTVVTGIQVAMTEYENLTLDLGITEYNRRFAKLTKQFQICLSALMLYVSFTVQERNQIHQNLNPPPAREAGRGAYAAVAGDSKAPAISPSIIGAVLTLTKYDSMLEELG